MDKLASPVLQQGTDKLEEIVFMPELSIPETLRDQDQYFAKEKAGDIKITFNSFFEAVHENEEIHEALFETMSGKMLLKD